MPSIYDLKPKFQNALRPVCGRLARAGITANQVTVAAMVLSIGEGAWIAVTHFYAMALPDAYAIGVDPSLSAWGRASLIALPVVLFVRMALNAIDGMLAREFNQKSRLGAVLNELGDVVSDAALYLPFALLAGVNRVAVVAVVAVVIVAIIGEMTGVVAVQIGGARRYDGPFGKSDRALFFGLLAIVLAAGVAPGMWTTIVLWLAAAAGALTILNRARRALASP